MMQRHMWPFAIVIAGVASLCAPAPGAATEGHREPEVERGHRESGPLRVSREELQRLASETSEKGGLGQVTGPVLDAAIITWTPLGPQPIAYDYWSTGPASGRVSSVVVDPRNGNVVYIAAAQGGVWKTTNGGTSWTPMTDGLSSLASGALALHPSNPDIVYYGTGEQHYSFDSFYGDGLFKSTDGGANWIKLANRSSVGSYVARVVPHRQDPETLYVASSRGFVRSLNGGVSWTATLTVNWCDDVVIDPADGDRVYAAIIGAGVFRSTNAGATWELLDDGGLPTSGIDRIQLAIAPSDPSVLYASIADPFGGLLGCYRSDDAGDTWTPLPAPNYLGGQGWYDHAIIVDPTDPDVCYAGGVYPYSGSIAGVVRTTDGGSSWDDVTFGVDGLAVHPDQHNFAFGPDGKLWLVNDGGVWSTTDGGDHWAHRNSNLNITQFYSIDVHPTDGNRILGGTQDNGTVLYEGAAAWPQVISGDGGYCLFLWNQPNLFYTTYVGLDPVFAWDDGSYLGDVTGPWTSLGERVSFILGPLVQDTGTPNTMLAGTHRVWRTNDRGDNWLPLSGDLPGGTAVMRSITVAAGSPNTIYAGASNGRLFVTTDASTWAPRFTDLPQKAINDVAVDPANAMKAWICSDTAAGGRVWSTSNAGVSWTNVSGNLPAGVRGMCLAADFGASPPRLYLGTDYGVYRSDDGGAAWHHENAGLPSLAVYDLKLGPGGTIVAGTHGRGMWRGTLPPVAVGDLPAGGTLLLAAATPARPPASIDFQLPSAGEVSLEVFDVAGRRVRELERGARPAGRHRTLWDGRDANGTPAGAGVYFYRLNAGAEARTMRFVLLR